MRFGNQSSLAFEVEPLEPSWSRVTASERGPWARLEIWVDGQNVCVSSVLGSSLLREAINVPLAPIAEWFVTNAPFIAFEESARAYPTGMRLHRSLRSWRSALPASEYDEDSWDDARYQWWQRHFLEAHGDGAWLPNLAWARSEGDLWISAGPSHFATPEAPRFYLDRLHTRVRWDDAASALEDFVSWVAQDLRDRDLSSSFPWSEHSSPLAEALAIDVEDYVEVALGLSPRDLEILFGASDVKELRTALSLAPETGPEESVALLALRDLEVEPDLGPILADLENQGSSHCRELDIVRTRLRGLARTATPVEQGKDAARAVRRSLGTTAEPLPLDELVSDLGIVVTRASLTSRRNRGLFGRKPHQSGRIALLGQPRPPRPWAERMEVARGLGHLLTDGQGQDVFVGAGSSSHASGPRRRRSGAFAAELLLPRAAILERTEGVLDRAADPEIFEGLMADFGVGARTAAWQCFNSDCFSSPDVRDEVISRYANDEVPVRAA